MSDWKFFQREPRFYESCSELLVVLKFNLASYMLLLRTAAILCLLLMHELWQLGLSCQSIYNTMVAIKITFCTRRGVKLGGTPAEVPSRASTH
jgi:hypothetical protein